MICENCCESQPIFSSTDYISGRTYDVIQCSACEFARTEVEKGVIHDKSAYPTQYYGKQSRYGAIFAFLSRILIRMRLRYLGPLGESGHAVDVGCGQGWLVKELSEKDGWTAQGIEVSSDAAYHAKEVLKQDILVGDSALSEVDDNSVDALVIWHVLEHVDDPKLVLNEIARVVKASGRAMIGVPNFSSIEAKFGRDGWFHLDVPRHLIHFNEKNLKLLLNQTGLKVVSKHQFVPEYDFFSFVQTCQNRLGIKKNLLYTVLRRGELGDGMKNATWVDWLGIFVTTPILSLMSLVYVPAVLLINSGSSLILIVEKK